MEVSTSPHLASRMLFTAANNFDDIKNCTVGDFGCGAGVRKCCYSLQKATFNYTDIFRYCRLVATFWAVQP